jgi:pyruvate formate lyase activating enzyme
MILDIHRSALHDGPGIRTTVFLKGCPLHCQWCHNPESVSSSREIAFFRDKCILCGACAEACPEHAHKIENGQHIFERSLCRLSGKCVEACLYGALTMTGRKMKDVEVIELVLRDKAYYDESGGGLTLSGGEPMHQFAFTLSVMKMAKASVIHTCLDTSGYAPVNQFEKILPYVDLFLYDIKASDTVLHKEITGVSNDLIWQNFEFLYNHNAAIELRCPLVPGNNDQEYHLERLREIRLRYQNVRALTIMPFHNTARSKYERYGYTNPFPGLPSADDELIAEWNAVINE